MTTHLDQIRNLTANYARLQGLRAIPVGIFILFAGIWTNLPVGQDGDLGLPLVMILVAALVYFGVDRYYAHAFGQVTQTARERNVEISTSVIFGLLAFGAFIFDTSKTLPISTLGLVFAIGALVDAWQAARRAGQGSLGLYPELVVGAAVVILFSLLPLVGLRWWEMLGMKSSPAGMLILFGVVTVCAGLLGHFRFLRALKTIQEASHA